MHGPVTIAVVISFLKFNCESTLLARARFLPPRFLPDMAVNQPSSNRKQPFRHMRKYALCHLQLPAIDRAHNRRFREFPVHQSFGLGHPMVFKCEKPGVVRLRASHIKLVRATRFSGLDCPPQKPWRCPKLIKLRIGTSILVVESISEVQSKDRRHWNIVFISKPNIDRFILVPDQVAEPFIWDGRQAVTPS